MLHSLPRVFLLACTVLAAASGAPAQTPPQAPAKPPGSTRDLERYNDSIAQQAALCPIKATPAVQNFGIVAPHSLVQMTATITNPLDYPVTCVVSKPTCTCTTVDMVGKVIPAKGSVEVPLSMKTSGSTGAKTAEVNMIFQRAPGEMVPGVVNIKLIAEVAHPVRGVQFNTRANGTTGADPFINAFDFPQQSKGEVTVESTDGKPFRILSVMTQPPVFADGFNPATDEPRAKYRVNYDFSTLPCEQIPKWLLIETDRADAPLVDMRIRHRCTHLTMEFAFGAYYENLGVLTAGQPRDFTVEIKHGAHVRVDGVRSLDPRVPVEIVGMTSDGSSNLYTLRVTPAADLRGILTVPVQFTGSGPDFNKPVPPGGQPVILPRSGPPYTLFMKVVPPDASPSSAPPQGS